MNKNRRVGLINIYDKQALMKSKNNAEFPMGFGKFHPDPFYLGGLVYRSSVAFPDVVQTNDLKPNNAFIGYHNTNEYIEPRLKETTGQALPYPPKPDNISVAYKPKVKNQKTYLKGEVQYDIKVKPKQKTYVERIPKSIMINKKNKRMLAASTDYNNDYNSYLKEEMKMKMKRKLKSRMKKEKKEKKYEIKI